MGTRRACRGTSFSLHSSGALYMGEDIMQMPVLKQLSLRAVMALLAASVLPACVMARAEAPPIPDVEQDDASQPAEQVYSTREDDPPGRSSKTPTPASLA